MPPYRVLDLLPEGRLCCCWALLSSADTDLGRAAQRAPEERPTLDREGRRLLERATAVVEAADREHSAVLMRDLERDLGPFEHLLWLTDQWAPRHFAVAARIRGRLGSPSLQNALLRAQRRHPALRAAIDASDRHCPRFGVDDCGEIPLRVCDRIVGDEWRTELVSELATPFDAHRAPLVRAVLVRGPSVSELLLLVHHALGDALAAAYLIRDLLEDIAGTPMPDPLPPRPSMEQLLGLSYQCGRSSSGTPPRLPRNTPRASAFEAWEIGPDSSDELVDRCRAEQTTVQGALTAAFTLALSASGRTAPGGIVRCLSPISVRRLCPPVDADFGLYVASAKTCHRPAASSDLWELARTTRGQIAAGSEREQLAARAAGQQALLATRPTPGRAFAAYRSAVDYQVIISNIGRALARTRYGALRLEALWVVPNVEEEPVVGVATVARRMCISLLGDSVPGLVENALERLPVAVPHPISPRFRASIESSRHPPARAHADGVGRSAWAE
jgi:hypothetical protein